MYISVFVMILACVFQGASLANFGIVSQAPPPPPPPPPPGRRGLSHLDFCKRGGEKVGVVGSELSVYFSLFKDKR